MIEKVSILLEICAVMMVFASLYKPKLKADLPFAILASKVIVGIIQLVLGGLAETGNYSVCDGMAVCFTVNIITVVLVAVITFKKDFSFVLLIVQDNYDKYIKIVVICAMVILLFMDMVYKVRKYLYITEYIMAITIFILICVLVLQWNRRQLDNAENYKKIRAFKICDKYYSKLVADVRCRQHEFNNHLAAINGLSYTCSDFSELVEKQRYYFGYVQNNNKFNKLVYSCHNPILNGFLYNKFLNADSRGVDIEFRVVLKEVMDENIEIFDLVEITGILFDNAVEAVEKREDKRVKVEIFNENEGIAIVIKNASKAISGNEIDDFFKPGYSSKGEGRGLGLNKVLKLKDKYGGRIEVGMADEYGARWIEFKVVLVRKKW